jgi:hypothetical protein
MTGGQRTQAKVVGTFFLIFAPYAALIAIVAISLKGAPMPRWVPLVGLAYVLLGIRACMVESRRLYNRELSALTQEQIDQSRRTYDRPDFPALKIPIAYLSSLDHLKQFQALPWYAKFFGRVPEGFPFVMIGRSAAPLVYVAQGELTLCPAELKFAARQPVSPLKTYFNLKNELQFRLAPDPIVSVMRFDMREVTTAPIRFPFLRIRASDGILRDFLICNGSEDLSAIPGQTEDLLCALQSFAGSRALAETPA